MMRLFGLLQGWKSKVSYMMDVVDAAYWEEMEAAGNIEETQEGSGRLSGIHHRPYSCR